jgi:hypothetical protein
MEVGAEALVGDLPVAYETLVSGLGVWGQIRLNAATRSSPATSRPDWY